MEKWEQGDEMVGNTGAEILYCQKIIVPTEGYRYDCVNDGF